MISRVGISLGAVVTPEVLQVCIIEIANKQILFRGKYQVVFLYTIRRALSSQFCYVFLNYLSSSSLRPTQPICFHSRAMNFGSVNRSCFIITKCVISRAIDIIHQLFVFLLLLEQIVARR